MTGNQQAYDWILPSDLAPSRTAVIRVTATDAAGNAQSATSDLLTVIGSGFTPNTSAAYTYDALNRLAQASLGDGRTIQYAGRRRQSHADHHLRLVTRGRDRRVPRGKFGKRRTVCQLCGWHGDDSTHRSPG